jgi:hypothetical protein
MNRAILETQHLKIRLSPQEKKEMPEKQAGRP